MLDFILIFLDLIVQTRLLYMYNFAFMTINHEYDALPLDRESSDVVHEKCNIAQ
jgi:hypothetical protein